MHQTVLNMARCMLFASGLPLYFWGDGVEHSAQRGGRCSVWQPVNGFPGAREEYVEATRSSRNVETLHSKQNAQLQAQLEREDSELRCSVVDCEEVVKRKEQVGNSPTISVEPAILTEKGSPTKSRKRSTKKITKTKKEGQEDTKGSGRRRCGNGRS
ncbi:hypothetical protein PC110_g14636 [Phytophthora cactorum]|uniref:Uncharacterized protein n=1 Tax=Phytophthora cactorum TaxID=29920 RepID=A0A329RZH7_9STRA|nr:hypothetical protein PC110_g14636 [Phytophthora cactorum]